MKSKLDRLQKQIEKKQRELFIVDVVVVAFTLGWIFFLLTIVFGG